MLPGRRSSIDIVADMLSLLRLGETGKTEIMLVVGMSFYQLQNYINRLLKLNLIVRAGEDGLIAYQATEKGLRLLTAIENVREMLRPVGRIDLLAEYKVKAASPELVPGIPT